VSRYTADSRDRVRDSVDMLALVGGRVDLTQRGRDSYFGCCPFHDERTPSFHVRPDEKHYHCFGCSESGDPFDFVMQTEGLDFKGALESLADRFGVKLETEEESPEAAAKRARRERLYGLLARVTTYYERYFWESDQAREARDYMLGRGLSEETLREFRVGLSPDSWDRVVTNSRQAGYSSEELLEAGLAQRKRSDANSLLDRFRGRIMFPTSDARGRVIGFGARIMAPADREAKYVNTAEGEIYHKRAVLYGINLARPLAAKAGHMVLAEGYTDVMALHQAGITNAVGIMGTSLTSEQVAELVRSVGVLELCLDADNAGREAMVRAARLCADSGLELRVVPLPVGADPGDMISQDGPEALRDRVAASVPYVVFDVQRTLAAADVGSAEGKDRAIAALRPVLAPLAPSVLRDELVRTAATALGVPEPRLVTLLGEAVATPSAVGNGASAPALDTRASREQSVGGSRTGTQASPGVQTERSFLAMCLAAPELGAVALATIDPDAVFLDDRLRRAARFLAANLPGPLPEPSGEDPELVVVIDDLVDRAHRGRRVSGDELEHARLVLELDRLKREIKYLRERGGAGGQLAELAREQQAARSRISGVATRLD
jgi:DNA primase